LKLLSSNEDRMHNVSHKTYQTNPTTGLPYLPINVVEESQLQDLAVDPASSTAASRLCNN